MNWLRKNDPRTEHRYVEDRLSAYLDGELGDKERIRLERHLDSCRMCRLSLETLRQTVRWTRGMRPVPLPRSFTIPVSAAPRRAPAGARRPLFSLPVMQAATAVVAVMLILVVAGDFLLTGLSPQRAEAPVALLQQAPASDQAPQNQIEGTGEAGAGAREAMPAEEAEPLVAETMVVQEAPAAATEEAVPPAEPEGLGAGASAPTEEPQQKTAIATAPTETQAEAERVQATEVTGEEVREPITGTERIAPPGMGGAITDTQPMEGLSALSTPVVTLSVDLPAISITVDITLSVKPAFTPTATVERAVTEVSTTTTEATGNPPTTTMDSQIPTPEPAWPLPTGVPSATPTDRAQVEGPPGIAQPTPLPAPALLSPGAAEEALAPTASGPEPTAMAYVSEQVPTDAPSESMAAQEDQPQRAGRAQSAVPWLTLAEVVLGLGFVVLATATLVMTVRRRLR